MAGKIDALTGADSFRIETTKAYPAGYTEMTDEEFRALEAALDACTIHGHRGIMETEQSAFGNKWKRTDK